jgi:4-amino-4-deoxy-L-arabinose transferase-like glycosyltransferase
LQCRHYFAAAAALLALVAVGRVVSSYRLTAPGFDEPCHVASGLELLDKHTYTLNPVHPTLARIAIALPLYLAGERYPNLPATDPVRLNYNVVGNTILYGDGHCLRNLSLARLGVLPFFLVAAFLVFLWTRRLFGDFAALIAVALFTTVPSVLAFAGLAYTDMPAACAQFAALFAFAIWLERRTPRSTVFLGIACGLALLAKLTSAMFLPVAVVAILACVRFIDHQINKTPQSPGTPWARQIAAAALLASFVVWAGYGFSVGHVREAMQLSPESMPTFQHFPGPPRSVAQNMILSDPALPAPALLKGVATAWVLNKSAPQSYLLGTVKSGGWWYFSLVAVAVKTPLPLLVLFVVGLFALIRIGREGRWPTLAPAASTLAILVTMSVTYAVGVRHVLVIFPLFAVVAGCGAAYLWRLPKSRVAGQYVLAGLLLWQAFATFSARNDFISYFNELAGKDPSQVLVTGCDLDCGQDLIRLSNELRSRRVAHLSLAVWSSAEISQMGLPTFEIAPPFQPVKGWVAISMRSLRLGDVLHESYPRDAFAWLERYQPVKEIGKSIRLYYIPEDENSTRAAQMNAPGPRQTTP